MKRTETKKIFVGNVQIGGQNKIIIQSMTNTKTKDIEATVAQCNALVENGCQLIRVAVLDEEDALAIAKLKPLVAVPLIADIHFNPKFAMIAIESGVDKIRINPGHLGKIDQVKDVVLKCKELSIPIRVGINTGSLEKEIVAKYNNEPCAEAMIESAQKHVDLLESWGFDDMCLSFKSSDVQLTIDVYRLAAKTFKYPLHLGVTEAGSFNYSAIKSSAALGTLIEEGIGDTMRISVSSDPVDELKICKQLLNCFGLIEDVPNLISCPTCGRIQYDMLPIVDEIEDFLNTINSDITVAIMGCPVNGPQEASRADIGVAGGYNQAILFKKGKLIRNIKQEDIVDELKTEILAIMAEKNAIKKRK
jgi:(E)-4-hydroxy-3-methylbut-2-enyl-diphosphate synthase